MCCLFGTDGFSSVDVVGSRVLVCLLNKCAGLRPIPSVGVFLKSRRANHGSLPAGFAFFKRLLIVFTGFSSLPLNCECPGLDVIYVFKFPL